MTEILAHVADIAVVDRAIRFDVVAEVRACDRVTDLAADGGEIAIFHCLIGVYVARKNVHAYRGACQSRTISAHDVAKIDRDLLHIHNPVQIHGHRVTRKDWAAFNLAVTG